MKEVIIKVEGMMCSGCENRVQNALKEIEGVDTVVANHEEGIVKVTLALDVDVTVLNETIEDLGFDVKE